MGREDLAGFPRNRRREGIRRRDFLRAVAVVGLAPGALLAASTRAAEAASAPTVAPLGPAAVSTGPTVVGLPRTTRAGDVLKLLWWQAPTILNSHLSQGTKDYDAARPVLEPLAATDPDGKPVPKLAAEVPTVANEGVSSDLKSVTWKLKQGVKWSDGTDFTADDVVFTYQYMSDKATAATDSTNAEGVESVVAKDPYTVVVTWQEPNPNPFQLFVSGQGNIIQKKQFADYMGAKAKDAPGNLAPVGTGPFKVRDFKPGDVVIYEPNPFYRESGKPAFKELQMKGGGDATSAARAVFQTGDADYAWNLQVENAVLQQIQAGGRGELITSFGSSLERLLLNRADPNTEMDSARSEPGTQHPFFSDLRVRQAFAMGVDRQAIAQQLYGVAGDPAYNAVVGPPDVVSPNTLNWDISQYNIDKANQLLDDAGWMRGSDGIRQKNGVQMKVVYQTTVNPLRQKTQDIVKQGWEQLGVSVELKAVQAGVFFSSDAGNPDTASHFYTDVEMFTNNSEQPDMTNYLGGWISKQIAQKSNEWRGNNYERWNNPDYDRLWQQLKQETNPARRRELVIMLNDLVIQDVVIIPLVARKDVAARSKQLQGVWMNSWDSQLWNIADWSWSS